MKKFQVYRQQDVMDCGPTCLAMIAGHYGKRLKVRLLRDATEIGKDGVNMLGIAQAAERVGFRTTGIKTNLNNLTKDAPLPCIAHWDQNHFIVIYRIDRKTIFVADPAVGLLKYSYSEFESKWANTVSDGEPTGVVLLFEPTLEFYENDEFQFKKDSKVGFRSMLLYVKNYKKLIFQLFLGVLAGSVIQLILPFLTQSVVDTGIQTRNLGFIYLVLAAQTMLLLGRMSVDFIRSWILIHVSSRINLSILSDFLIKLLKLPVSYFESKHTGDILQRIGDHQRIESFLTGTSLNTFFSLFNLLTFSVILAYYHLTIFSVFIISTIVYSLWIVAFLNYRKRLDHKRFALASRNQSSLIQLVQSVPELKLHDASMRKRWDWENLQVRDFKLGFESLALQQYQQVGAFFINEGKNIFITFLAATAVVNGQLTLGAMMALQYIIGQLNSPVEQLVSFVQHFQDAKLSLGRLNEVYDIKDEESSEDMLSHFLPQKRDISFENLSFTYPGAGNEPVLKDLNFTIPEGKMTAIVGSSGSGKTTILNYCYDLLRLPRVPYALVILN